MKLALLISISGEAEPGIAGVKIAVAPGAKVRS